jgi:hypothetical protein
MSLSPVVCTTFTSSSPSLRLMAIRPDWRAESYSDMRVFFTTPWRVAKNR